jgi:hypothetical protein
VGVTESEKKQDPRLIAELVSALNGEPVGPGIWAVAMSPLILADKTPFAFHTPQPIAFNLVEAHRRVVRSRQERDRILADVVPRPSDGRYRARDAGALPDCVGGLASGVLFAFTAIESFANHSIDQLDSTATLTLTRRDKTERIVTRDEMVRDLGIVEKLDRAVPLLTGRPSAKGGKAWQRFVHRKRLRDDLVHVKHGGYSTDPQQPSVYGRLILGKCDSCATEAAVLIRELRPEFLPPHLLEELGMANPPVRGSVRTVSRTAENRDRNAATRSTPRRAAATPPASVLLIDDVSTSAIATENPGRCLKRTPVSRRCVSAVSRAYSTR